MRPRVYQSSAGCWHIEIGGASLWREKDGGQFACYRRWVDAYRYARAHAAANR